jgi:hypothetical protein
LLQTFFLSIGTLAADIHDRAAMQEAVEGRTCHHRISGEYFA